MKTLYGCLLFLLFLSYGCSTTKQVSNQNIANIYKNNSSILHPQYTIFHSTDSLTTVYFNIDARELLYIKRDNTTTSAQLCFTYTLTESFESVTILDSSSLRVSDINNSNNNKSIIGSFTIKANYGKMYLAKIVLRDLNRLQSIKTSYLNIDKSVKNGRQDFLLWSAEKNTLLFRNYVDGDEAIKIQTANKNIPKLWVLYFNRNFPLPTPPYSEREFEPFLYIPDSVFTIMASDSAFIVTLTKKGFYHIQTDTSNKIGLTVYRFDADFPYIKTPNHLLDPLRYLTSKTEFQTMSNYSNKKLAVDSFWVHCGGNNIKGKELIRKFYGRMQDANAYYTSYLEGWKSDRGLIYLIYGPPPYLYKTNNLEVWSYDFGGSRGRNGLSYMYSFTFVKVINPFTNNDFRLDRNPTYKDNWYSAVESWRLGQISSDF